MNYVTKTKQKKLHVSSFNWEKNLKHIHTFRRKKRMVCQYSSASVSNWFYNLDCSC